jgi:hypothetical protein
MPESLAAPPAPSPTPAENLSASALHEEARRPLFGLRTRALVVGVPLVVAISFISVFADMVSMRVQFGVLQLAPPAIAGLFSSLSSTWGSRSSRGVSSLARRCARRLRHDARRRHGFDARRGRESHPGLAYLPYHATRENRFSELLIQYLPRWAVPFDPQKPSPAPPNITAFWDGLSPANDPVALVDRASGLVVRARLVRDLVFACLSTLLRRQWMDNEQIRFPLTILPLAIIKNEVEGEPFFSNRLMWMGFS